MAGRIEKLLHFPPADFEGVVVAVLVADPDHTARCCLRRLYRFVKSAHRVSCAYS